MRRRPFDPRLLRRVPATRRHFAVLGLTGTLTAVVVVLQATALASVLAAGAGGRLDRAALAAFVGLVAARGALLYGQGVVSAWSAATVKAELRAELLAAVSRRGPGRLAAEKRGEIATLVGRGLDGLDAYFTGYLPQLILGVTVPVAVLARLVFADWSSAVIVAVTLPLIPIFGALVGWQAQAATERQWRRLSMLGGHFLDMVAGLPTLRAFGRAKDQVEVVRRMADRHRIATMKTLRIAFLSALVLELVATLSVALVAVPIGLRLLAGGLTLQTALLVLLLAPEAYLPLRAAGSRFHASLEGLTALDAALTTLDDEPAPATAGTPAGRPGVIVFENVTVEYARTHGAAGRLPAHRARRADRRRRTERRRQVDPARPAARIRGAHPRSGARRRCRPVHDGPGQLAPSARLGAAAPAPVRRVAGRQHPVGCAAGRGRTGGGARGAPRRGRGRAARTGSTPRSASADTGCPAASGSAWRWPGRSSARPRSSCSTSPPPASTAAPRVRSSTRPYGCSATAPPSSSPTGPPCCALPTGWSGSTPAG